MFSIRDSHKQMHTSLGKLVVWAILIGMRINQLFGESYRPCLKSFKGLCCARI